MRYACHWEAVDEQLRSMSASGAVLACDSADGLDASALFCARSLAGVLHAAGAADKGLLVQLDARASTFRARSAG